MRAVGMAVAGAVAGWFGGLLVLIVVRAVTAALLPSPVTLKGLEIVLSVAGLVGGAVWGAREDRRAGEQQRQMRAQYLEYQEYLRRQQGGEVR